MWHAWRHHKPPFGSAFEDAAEAVSEGGTASHRSWVGREDVLTSMLIDCLAHMEAADILDVLLGRAQPLVGNQELPAQSEPMRLQPWPRWTLPPDADGSRIEPDLVIEMSDCVVVVEVKLPWVRHGMKQLRTQAAQAQLEYPERRLHHLALGGWAVCRLSAPSNLPSWTLTWSGIADWAYEHRGSMSGRGRLATDLLDRLSQFGIKPRTPLWTMRTSVPVTKSLAEWRPVRPAESPGWWTELVAPDVNIDPLALSGWRPTHADAP